MCEACLDAVARWLPKIAAEDRREVLIGATAYPIASHNYIERQLAELAAKTDGTLGGCIAFAESELDRALQKIGR